MQGLKVVIVGDFGVGKTSLIRQLTQRQFFQQSAQQSASSSRNTALTTQFSSCVTSIRGRVHDGNSQTLGCVTALLRDVPIDGADESALHQIWTNKLRPCVTSLVFKLFPVDKELSLNDVESCLLTCAMLLERLAPRTGKAGAARTLPQVRYWHRLSTLHPTSATLLDTCVRGKVISTRQRRDCYFV